MSGGEWSRSRFWLCHFLHNRHVRPKVAWGGGDPLPEGLAPALRRFLADAPLDGAYGGGRLVRRVVRRYGSDHAYVQSLRLLVKERQHHAALLTRLRGEWDVRPSSGHGAELLAGVATLPGARFELSILLLLGLIEDALLRLVEPATESPALRGVCQVLRHDRRQHRAFYAERLTMELADLNFARRNLRRLRLRGMFAAMLATAVVRYRELIDAAGSGRAGFTAGCWTDFDHALERMVPYHRDTLLAALLNQREHPYDKPREI